MQLPGEAEELLRMESSSVMLLADAESSSSSPTPGPPASKSTALLYKLRSAEGSGFILVCMKDTCPKTLNMYQSTFSSPCAISTA